MHMLKWSFIRKGLLFKDIMSLKWNWKVIFQEIKPIKVSNYGNYLKRENWILPVCKYFLQKKSINDTCSYCGDYFKFWLFKNTVFLRLASWHIVFNWYVPSYLPYKWCVKDTLIYMYDLILCRLYRETGEINYVPFNALHTKWKYIYIFTFFHLCVGFLGVFSPSL